MIKENLYLFLPYTGSNISIYTNNKQIYTIAQHSSSRNNTLCKEGSKKAEICTVHTSTKCIIFKKTHFHNIWEKSKTWTQHHIKKHEKLLDYLHCFW